MTKKRNRLEIIHDILKTINDKNSDIKPTHILYKSNLSYQMMEEYLKDLLEKNFIAVNHNKKGRTYSLTLKGQNYLDKYKLIKHFTDTFGLS